MGGLITRVLGPEDVPAFEAFVRARLESSMFLLGNLQRSGIVDEGHAYCGTYVGRFEGGGLAGVAAHYWNGNLMLQAPVPGDAAELTRAALAATHPRGLHGLIGPNDQVIEARDGLPVPADLLQLDQEDGLYALQLDMLRIPEALADGTVQGRRATMEDVDLLTAWRIDYEINLIRSADTPSMREQARAAVERTVAESRAWVLERDGACVAMTGFNSHADDMVQVGGVYTPAPLRGAGYARAVVAASLRDAMAEGRQRAILFTGVNNIPAQRAYLALGFERIGSFRLALLKHPWLPG